MEQIAILIFLLVLSGFFSGAETAMVSLTMVRVERLLGENRTGARALHRLKSNTNRMLIIILIGNNLVNIAASAMATILATERFGHLGPGLAVGVLTIIILIFGEVTPKTYATRFAVQISLFVAPPLLFFSYFVFPLAWVLERFTSWLQTISGNGSDPTITEGELVRLAELGAEEGIIEQDESELIGRLFKFDTLRAGDVMIPYHQVFSMDASLTLQQALPTLINTPHTRIPLYDGKPDTITGKIHLRDVLTALAEGREEMTLGEIGKDSEILFIPENQPIGALFDKLLSRKHHLIIVVNEFGTLQGVFTLEDLLEELVGEIHGEMERPVDRIQGEHGERILVDGSIEMREVTEHFPGVTPHCKPTDPVSRWILSHIKRIPAVGESFVIDSLEIQVVKADRRRISRVYISRDTEA